jgi:rhomboid family GlyGly-CTERM serine protease
MRHDRFNPLSVPAGRGVRAPLALALVAVAIQFIPHAAGMLELSRAAVLHGELWRIVTGHFTHFSNQHLAWDVVTFTVLGAMVAERSFARFVACLIGAAVAISAATLILRPDVAVYRGLSGVDSALFVTAAVMLLRQGWREGRQFLVASALLALAAFSAKTLFELATGKVLFVQELGDGVAPLALAHIAGGAWGGLAALWPISFRAFGRSPHPPHGSSAATAASANDAVTASHGALDYLHGAPAAARSP